MAIVSNKDPQADFNKASRSSSTRETSHAEPTPAEVAAEAAAIYPDTFDTRPSPEEIAAEAYAIYRSRGGDDGRDEEDWFEAERRLGSRRQRT